MAGKFMKIKRLVIPMLVLIAILAQTTPAFAMDASAMAEIIASNPAVTMEYAEVDAITGASPSLTDNHDGTFTYDKTGLIVNDQNEKVGQLAPSASMSAELTMLASNTSAQQGGFTDVDSNHWANGAIRAMTEAGVIKGIGDNKFAPEAQVSRAQFVAMTIRAYGGDEKAIAAEMGNMDEISKKNNGAIGFTIEVITAAQKFGLTDTFEFGLEDWAEMPATRGEMAYIIMTIAEQMGDEDFKITDGIKNNIGDYGSVSTSPYKDSILKAYSAGILVGTNSNGDYNSLGDSKRSQAATVMQRLLEKDKREPVEVKPAETKPPLQEGENIGVTGAVYPKEGDIINGVKVTRDPTTGVLGFGNGQTGGIYNGIQVKLSNGETITIQPGSYAAEDYDGMVSGTKYVQIGNYCYWASEWQAIDNVAMEKLPPASKDLVGRKADINGNMLAKGTTAGAVYECVRDEYSGICVWISK